MFGIGTQELIIILVIALLILGPKQLPELAKTIGKGLSELRRAMDGVKDTVNPTSVLNRMMEEEDKKETAKKEAKKDDAAADTKTETTTSDAETADAAKAEKPRAISPAINPVSTSPAPAVASQGAARS